MRYNDHAIGWIVQGLISGRGNSVLGPWGKVVG